MWATPSCSHFLDMCWLVIVTDEFQRGWWCYLLPYPIAILPCCRCSGFNWAQNPAIASPQWCRKRPSCCMDKSTQLCDWEEGQNFSKWPHTHWWHPGMLSQPQRKSIIHKEYPIAIDVQFQNFKWIFFTTDCIHLVTLHGRSWSRSHNLVGLVASAWL